MKTYKNILLLLLIWVAAFSPCWAARYVSTCTYPIDAQTCYIDGPNLYTYVEQNPWTKFDPQGLQAAEASDGEGEAPPPGGNALDYDTVDEQEEQFNQMQKMGLKPVRISEETTEQAIARLNRQFSKPGSSPGGTAPTEGSARDDKENSETKAGDKTTGTKPPPPNPNGSKGAPDHQNAVSKIVDFFKKLFPDDRVESNKGIPGSNRKPDASVIAPDGTLKAVGEAARTNKDGSLVPREQAKQDEYNKAGIPSTVITLPKTPTLPNSPSPAPQPGSAPPSGT